MIVLGLGFFVFRQPLQQRLEAGRPLPVTGRVVLPTERGLSVYSLADKRQDLIITAGTGENVTAAAWSPDGSKVAYGLFHRRQGDPALVGEIYLSNGDGSNPHVLAERDRPGTVLDQPVWSRDGRFVFFSYLGQASGRITQRIERIAVEGGERSIVVENAYNPDISTDGRSLLFLRDEPRSGTGLYLLPLDGGQPTPVLAPGRYPALAGPRFAPDGQHFAIAIMDTTAAVQPRASDPFAWLLPTPALAHGAPWDIWSFDLQGGSPKRLTQLGADEPVEAWSPDGRYLVVWSPSGLYLVSADGSDSRLVVENGSYGAPDWER